METSAQTMIKASELRIGNRVMRCNEFGEWEDVILLPGMIVDCSEFPDLYKPIPLTAEILEKCWFTKEEGFEKEYSLDAMKGKLWINWSKEMGIYLGYRDLRFHPDYDIDYLHQLQNVYFALTGEELQ